MKGGTQAPEWRSLHCRLGALSACRSFWSILPSYGERHMGTFIRISFGRQAKQRENVCNCIWFSMCLSSVSEWPPVFLALITWLFYFWVEGLHLILQSESWFHITDTFAWMKTSTLGELKTDDFWLFSKIFCSKPVYLQVWKSVASLTYCLCCENYWSVGAQLHS